LPDSFPLNAGWGNKRDFYVRSCVNKWSDSLRYWTARQFLTPAVALIFAARRHLLATVLGSVRPAERGFFPQGEAAMAKVLNEILLFSSMAVFVTGIVLAAARLLI
jgi:hypothetical protein